MNLPDADPTRLAQEAAALFKRSALISKEAGRFADMAVKVGGKTRPALRLLTESDRLQAEANALRAEAERLQAQSQELLPAAEIVEPPARLARPVAPPPSNVVDVEPLPAPPKSVALKPAVEISRPAPQIPQPASAIPKPVVGTVNNPTTPKPEAPSAVLREVNRFHERAADKSRSSAPKTEETKTGFFRRIFGGGKPATKTTNPPAIARPTAVAMKPAADSARPVAEVVKPAAPPAKPTAPMFEAPKVGAPNAAPPKISAPAPAPPRAEKPAPPPVPVAAPKPVVAAPVAPKLPPAGFVTCHCPHCEQGVEFEAAQLPEDDYVIPCPNCGEEMKLSVP